MNTKTQESFSMREALLEPWLREIPFVLSKPLSKRWPNGTRIKNRHGFTSIQLFTQAIQHLQETYPGLFVEADDTKTEPVFQLYEKLYPNT